MEITNENWYKCKKCGLIKKRNSNKKWIKSYCKWTNEYSRMYLVTKD